MSETPEETRHTCQATLYLNEQANDSRALVEMLLGDIPDGDGARFTRVTGDGYDTAYRYEGLPWSTIATLPAVFVVALRAKTTDVHAFLAALPWGAAGAGVAIMTGTDKPLAQVNVLGRWALPA